MAFRSAFEQRMFKLASFGQYKVTQRRCAWMWNYKGTMAQYIVYTRVTHCEICGSELNSGGSKRCQDHCHNTGQLRGVLCSRCNCAQGYLRTKENAMKMVEYFVKWEIMPVAPTTTETNEKPDAYEGFTLFDVSNSPLEPPLTPIAPVVTVGGTTTKRTRSVCVVPHAITPRGASIEDVEVTPDV
jgi:hypothetical protein